MMFFSFDTNKSEIHELKNQNFKVIFLFRQKICFVCVTKKSDDSNFLINSTLDFLNLQVKIKKFNTYKISNIKIHSIC